MIRAAKKAVTKKRMIGLLDKAAREQIVIERDHNVCQRCGRREGEWDSMGMVTVKIQWSHVHSRRFHCIRWDPDNSKALCQRCHCWWTNNPGLAFDWFSKKFPERWERVTRVLQSGARVNVRALYEELRQK